jgi:hypothetical protein
MPKKRKQQLDPSYAHRWDELALYNAECARGIAHTPEWDERMARRQALFDSEVAEQATWQAEVYIMRRRSEAGLKTPAKNGLPAEPSG